MIRRKKRERKEKPEPERHVIVERSASLRSTPPSSPSPFRISAPTT